MNKKSADKIEFVLMKEHPLLGYALSFMIGAYFALIMSVTRIYIISALIILVLCALFLIIKMKKSWYVFLLIFLVSGYLLCAQSIPTWYKEEYVPPSECQIVGTVESVEITGYSSEYILDDVTIGMRSINSKIKVKNITQSNCIKSGDRIKMNVVLEKPAAAQINGMFSESRYYMTKNIQYLATVFDPKITVLRSDISSVSANAKWQCKIYKKLKADFAQPVLGMIYSISTGNKEYLNQDFYSMCQSLGIAHIFAISGLHIGALLIIWELYCRKRKKRFLIKILGSCILIGVLYIVVGSRASLLRAIAMWSLVVVYHYAGVKGDLIDFLSLAMIGLLVFNPLYVVDLGFILSITCVGAIALVYTPVMRKFKGSKLLNFYPVSMFIVSLAILSFSWVITAKAFNQVAILSPVWNVVFVPLAIVLLSLMLVYSLTFYIPLLSTIIIWIIDKLGTLIIKLVELCSSVNINVEAPNIGLAASVCIVALFLIMTDALFKGRKNIRVASGILGIALILGIIIFWPKPNKMEVFAGYDAPFIYIREDDETILILNEDDGGIDRVLKDIDATEIDTFIYSGNDVKDLDELLAGVDRVKFGRIIVHENLLEGCGNQYGFIGVSSGESIVYGDTEIRLDEFRANKNAITHYYAEIDYYDREFVYLDPLRLREGALDDCEIVISSAWTKQRIENLNFVGCKYVIMNSRDYRMDDLSINNEGNTIPRHNINNSGSFTYFP